MVPLGRWQNSPGNRAESVRCSVVGAEAATERPSEAATQRGRLNPWGGILEKSPASKTQVAQAGEGAVVKEAQGMMVIRALGQGLGPRKKFFFGRVSGFYSGFTRNGLASTPSQNAP